MPLNVEAPHLFNHFFGRVQILRSNTFNANHDIQSTPFKPLTKILPPLDKDSSSFGMWCLSRYLDCQGRHFYVTEWCHGGLLLKLTWLQSFVSIRLGPPMGCIDWQAVLSHCSDFKQRKAVYAKYPNFLLLTPWVLCWYLRICHDISTPLSVFFWHIGIVMCQWGGVSVKLPWLQAVTRHRPLTLSIYRLINYWNEKDGPILDLV